MNLDMKNNYFCSVNLNQRKMESLAELREYFQGQVKSSYSNYSIGTWKPEEYIGFAEYYSKRAFDALEDPSKISESDLISLIYNITKDDKELILKVLRKIISESLLEYHHVGKKRGKSRKKSYFYSATQIVRVCDEYYSAKEKVEQDILKVEQDILKKEKAKAELPELEKQLKEIQGRGKWFNRVSRVPDGYTAIVYSEMKGKHGWFDSSYRYNLPEYYSGYIFETEDDLNMYRDIKSRIRQLEKIIYS